jgi:hypothetical protein
VFCYKAKSGKTRISSYAHSATNMLEFSNQRLVSWNIPPALKTWLFEKDATGKCIRDFSNLYVSLGPDGKAYWATDKKRYVWASLPAQLETAISGLLKDGKWSETPRLVTLGFGGDYFMLTENNACHWLMTNYGELNSAMSAFREKRAFNTVGVRTLSISLILFWFFGTPMWADIL